MNCLFKILSNPSTAAVLGVLVAGFFARQEYRKQKKSEREFIVKNEIINDILSLQDKINYTLLIIDRVANSWSITGKGPKDFLDVLEKNEISVISEAINDYIPSFLNKIIQKVLLTFDDKDIIDTLNTFKDELKKWHEPIVNMQFDLKKRVKEQPELHTEKIQESIKLLIKKIWSSKTIYT